MLHSNGCSLCGATKAEGWGYINGDKFCYSDSLIANCFQEAQWAIAAGYEGDWLEEDSVETMKKKKEEYK